MAEEHPRLLGHGSLNGPSSGEQADAREIRAGMPDREPRPRIFHGPSPAGQARARMVHGRSSAGQRRVQRIQATLPHDQQRPE
ncbi:MAG TPA: hypothetical protein VK034_07000, partial [Enhygromyxa sp.]|nr:hypothetical protein [Enhygromyxa sp.]